MAKYAHAAAIRGSREAAIRFYCCARATRDHAAVRAQLSSDPPMGSVCSPASAQVIGLFTIAGVVGV